MSTNPATLTGEEYSRFTKCPAKCPILRYRIESLADYFQVISSVLSLDETFWFRGHADVSWSLTPSALRPKKVADRDKALGQLTEFKRVAEIKLERPPATDDDLKWLQLAQHYGLPTRLLDWTQNATIALYFSCLRPDLNGAVFILNPVDLNMLRFPDKPRVLDSHLDAQDIEKNLRLSGRMSPRGPHTIAISPIWNSERIMLQKGTFTLHGSRRLALTGDQASSLVAVPVLSSSKRHLQDELERVGIDEMAIFPELEHACKYLKRKIGT